MRKLILTTMGLTALMAQSAFAQDMNIEEGKWELTMTADVFGNPLNETSSECTAPEDLDRSVTDFLNTISVEMGCTTSGLKSTDNIHEGEIVCASDGPFKDGKFILMTSPRSFSLYLSFKSTIARENNDAKMAILSHKTGPC